MTTHLRRLVAAWIARRVNRALATKSACSFTTPSLGLFGDARRSHVRSTDRIIKLQARVNRRLEQQGARVAVTKHGSRLNVHATKPHQPEGALS